MSFATGFLLPAEVDFVALIGFGFTDTITLYQDDNQVTPLPLDSFVVRLIIETTRQLQSARIGVPTYTTPTEVFNLTDGNGLSITPVAGRIDVALTSEQTGSIVIPPTFPGNEIDYHWKLKLTDATLFDSCPMAGTFTFRRV